jgi:hypothetical protein
MADRRAQEASEKISSKENVVDMTYFLVLSSSRRQKRC